MVIKSLALQILLALTVTTSKALAANDVDFNDEEEENLRTILPSATEILNDWNLFVNEDKTDFTHVYLASSGEKDEQGNLIAGNELWRKSITLG